MRLNYWSRIIGIWFLALLIAGCAGPSWTTANLGDISLQVLIDPDPPRVGDNILKIKLLSKEGKVVKDAAIHLTYSMPAMGNMPAMRSETGADLKGDIFEANLSLSMLGSWDLKGELHLPGKPHLVAVFKLTTGTKGVLFISGASGMKGEMDLFEETNIVKLTEAEEKIIGVQTEPAARRKLVKEIRAVGKVAYDPDLYVAQEEFIGALKLNDENLAETARQRLRILGMGMKEIGALAAAGKPYSNLLLPEGKVWVYADFYESELTWLKEGQKVVVKTSSAPELDFKGEVFSIDPIVDEMARTLRARIEVDNLKLTLKPNMYVEVYLKSEFPRAVLAVPSEAVLDTGVRKLVYVYRGKGRYAGREVKVGVEAAGYYPVLAGIAPGERVVSRANFLIDSQSRLAGGASALYGSAAKEMKTEHKH